MVKFDGRIVQFGFGAVGKSFYEKIRQEIQFKENQYYVITRDKSEFEAYINLGGIATNFLTHEINRENFKSLFEKYLTRGDLLIDFADTVGTKDILEWCVQNNIMYINTGEADWPENWYSIFNENKLKNEIKEKYHKKNKYPIVLQHGNNPGLVSHFVKKGIEYIVHTQYKKDKQLKKLVMNHQFKEVARILNIKMIHVNDIDLQKIEASNYKNCLYNTWCVDSFFFELLSEATVNMGTHENMNFKEECKMIDKTNGYLELKKLAVDTKCCTYYPYGKFDGYLVPHEETITIAKSLEIKENERVVYRPTVMFIYAPCDSACNYLKKAKVNEYPEVDPNKPLDCENENGETITRGYIYPEFSKIVYKEKIMSGTEYVGVLLMGENFEPVWVGNRIEPSFLYKQKNSYWQTPTITPVAMSALATVCWMIRNKDKGGIYFPEDITDYNEILKKAEKYISKTIYKTFQKKELEEELKVDMSNLQMGDFFIA